MNYIANYRDPWDLDGMSEEGTVVTNTITLRISSNMALNDEQIRETLRRHLREYVKITDIKEQKIQIA